MFGKPWKIFILAAAIFSASTFAHAAVSAQSEASESSSGPYRRWLNIRINPQGLLYDVWGASVEVRLSDHLALGPNINYFKGTSNRNDFDVFQYGVALSWYFGGICFDNSWYLRAGPGAISVPFTRLQNGQTYYGTYHAFLFRASSGRNWAIWEGLNAGFGAGFSAPFGSPTLDLKTADGESITRSAPVLNHVVPYLELNVAWAF